MQSTKRGLLVLAFLLMTLWLGTTPRTTFAEDPGSEGAPDGVLVEAPSGQAPTMDEAQIDGGAEFGCRPDSFSEYIGEYAYERVQTVWTTSGCGGTVYVDDLNRGTYVRAIAKGRAPGAWVLVPAGTLKAIATWLPAGTEVDVQILHYDRPGWRFVGTIWH